jgi:hypothetical protein
MATSAPSRIQHGHGAADAGVAAGNQRRHAGQLAAAAVVRREEFRFLLHVGLQPRLVQVLGRLRRAG